ncbi:diguanylate cyclase [Alkalimarinus alittae]|uniref:diguanylate cyclase n=1 Tax=Alkalimarinus alittae TaxID=2961619 RepID=A0ABY6N5N9_9ALTE|nr:diguanylate cyclase [Alkalimarinus alittae]UZE97394.1 diguanylate cyclase [Alkalimarinus alittae]
MLSKSVQSNVVSQINSDIVAINNAILLHKKWLAEWNKKLVFQLPISDEFIQSNAHKHCGFGLWYYGEHSLFTEEQDEFPRLGSLHIALHDSVRHISLKIANKQELTPEDYDKFTAKEIEFTLSMTHLRDALFGQLYSFDYLTGVHNRQALYALLEREHARLTRTSGVSSIVMVDLDYFKKVNDQYGHQAGDEVLMFFANYLKERLRPYDSIGRYGGEEFLLCLPDTSINDTEAIMNRIREDLAAQPIDITGLDGQPYSIKITASFGVSSISKRHPISEAVETADIAMYQAKSAGRNRVKTYHYKDQSN